MREAKEMDEGWTRSGAAGAGEGRRGGAQRDEESVERVRRREGSGRRKEGRAGCEGRGRRRQGGYCTSGRLLHSREATAQQGGHRTTGRLLHSSEATAQQGGYCTAGRLHTKTMDYDRL